MKLVQFAGISLICCLASCNIIQFVPVSVNYKPRISLSDDSTTIVVINRYDFSREKNTPERKQNVIKAAAFTSIKYAASRLMLIPKTKVINLADTLNFTVNTDSVKDLALKYHADYILALKYFDAAVNFDSVENGFSYYNTAVNVSFVLYEDNGVHFKVLNGKSNEPQPGTPYSGLLGSLIVHPTINSSKSYIAGAAQHATDNALGEYLPRMVSYNRPLYNDAYLLPAVKEILQKNFEKAEGLLTPFLKNPDDQVVSRTAYDLAVVYEAEGDKGGAIEMAQLSLRKKKNPFATVMLSDLATE